jgi:hypothetical protein
MRRIFLATLFLLCLSASVGAQTKISDLPAATSATGDDLLVIVDSPASSSATKKITVTNFSGSLFASPVFTGQPTIPDFTNAAHSHQNAAGGGTLNASAIGAGQLANARGGTGLDTSSSTGIPYISSGTWTAGTGFKFDGTNLSVGLGSTVAPTAFTVGDTSSSSPRGLMSWQSSSDTSSAHLHMRKSRGTFGTPLTIVTGDVLGRVVFAGYEGSAYNESAYVRAVSTGTIGSTRVPSKLEFYTSTNAAPSVATLAVTIDESQNMTVAGLLKAGSSATVLTDAAGKILSAALNTVAAAQINSTVLDSSVAYCADAGANDTYTCSLTPAPSSYATGARYRFKANTANTGAATLNLNSLGAKTIKKAAGGVTTDLSDNDIRAGQVVDVAYDGTNLQMQSGLGNAASGGSPGGSDTQLQYNNASAFGGVTGATSDGTNVTYGSGNLRATSPRITTGVNDSNGNSEILFTATASAVNQFTVTNAATGGGPNLSATGSDTNIGISITPKGAGFNTSTLGGVDLPWTASTTRPALTVTTATGKFGVYAGSSVFLGTVSNHALSFITNNGNPAFTVTSAGTGFNGRSSAVFGWVSSSSDSSGTADTGLARNAAGVVEVNNGTAGTYRDLKVRQHYVDQTVTAGGTTGAQTINKAAGTVNFAASATALTVTNSLVTTSSTVYAEARTNDSTCSVKNVVPGSGSFTINMSAACTAETSVGFHVVN